MAEASFAAAIGGWLLLPGLWLTWAAGVRWSRVERLAAAPGLSVAVVSFAAYLTSAIGLPLTPWVVAAVILAGGGLVAAAGRRRRGEAAAAPAPDWWPAPVPSWIPWLALLLPIVVIRQLQPMWSAGLLVPPTLYDGLDHAVWFRLILDTRSVSPAVVMAPPLDPAGAGGFYPWGMHAWLALVASCTALDPMVAFFRGLVALSAVLPLSIYVFAAWFMGRGWPSLAAAAFALVFWWLPYQAWGWGGYALLAGAVAALPVSRLALDAVRGGPRAGVLAAGLAGVGVLLVHPSQAMAALIIGVVVTLTLAAGGQGRWRDVFPFVAALGGVAAALVFGADAWAPLASFLERARNVGATLANNAAYDWPGAVYAGAVWQLPQAARVVLGALYVIGGLVALRHAALRPLLAVHVVFSVMIPLAAYQTWLTSFWYHAPERIWYLQYACLPALAALGVAGVFRFVDRLTRDRLGIWRRQAVVWPAVLVVFFGGVRAGYTERATNFLRFFAHRSSPPLPTDTRLLDDFAWIRAEVPRDDVIFNASADWGLSVPFTGRRTVFWSGGYAIDPSTNWHQLQTLLARGDPFTSLTARELEARGLRYIYAAAVDPRYAINGREPLPVGPLASSEALEQVYASATGSVFRIREGSGVTLGLQDSDLVHFVDGFWGAEQARGRTWRWTNGLGRFQILPAARPAAGCFIRLRGPAPDAYRVTAEGSPLDLTARGFRLPTGTGSEAPVDVDILSSAASLADTTPGADPRRLGVQVFDITLDCG